MDSEPIVSIVVPTFNRLSRLRRCVDEIRCNVGLKREVIIVDGGSTDGSQEYLQDQSDLRVILEDRREGAVRAFNKGFRAARGQFIMWLNDDAWPLPGSVEAAVDFIERPDMAEVGMVAFYHTWHNERNVLDQVEKDGVVYSLCHVRGYPYANFGLLRRALLERIGFADERFFFFGFDPDLSLKVQIDEGLLVLGCREALVHHEEDIDDRKLQDLAQGALDNKYLFEKWALPEPGTYPDPQPGYSDVIRRKVVPHSDQRGGNSLTHSV